MIITIVGLLPLLSVLGVLRKAYKTLTEERTSFKSEEIFFKNVFLVDFLDEKRNIISNMIIYIVVSFVTFLFFFFPKIYPVKFFTIDMNAWYIIPLVILVYFIFSGFLFDMHKMPVYKSASKSKNITIFLKRTLEKEDIDEEEMIKKLKKLYEQCEKSKNRNQIKKIEEKIFKELK